MNNLTVTNRLSLSAMSPVDENVFSNDNFLVSVVVTNDEDSDWRDAQIWIGSNTCKRR